MFRSPARIYTPERPEATLDQNGHVQLWISGRSSPISYAGALSPPLDHQLTDVCGPRIEAWDGG